MKTNRTELLKALETVAIGLASKELIEQSTSYIFLEDAVMTYNDEVSVRYPITIGFTGVVPAKELLSFARKVKTDEIDMEIVDNEIILKSGRIRAGLTLQQEIKLPTGTTDNIGKWKPLPADFGKALKFCMGSCATDMSRFILTNVHVRGTDVVEGSDGHRISQYRLEKSLDCAPFLIPAHICSKIHGYDLKRVCVEDGWVHFLTKDEAIISCRIVSDAYPDTDQYMTVEGYSITFPKELSEALERASIFYKKDYVLDEMVEITLGGGKMVLSAKGIAGWSEEKLRVQSEAECVFVITPYLLQDILSQTNTAMIQSPKLLFEGENWKYLTLMRG